MPNTRSLLPILIYTFVANVILGKGDNATVAASSDDYPDVSSPA